MQFAMSVLLKGSWGKITLCCAPRLWVSAAAL